MICKIIISLAVVGAAVVMTSSPPLPIEDVAIPESQNRDAAIVYRTDGAVIIEDLKGPKLDLPYPPAFVEKKDTKWYPEKGQGMCTNFEVFLCIEEKCKWVKGTCENYTYTDNQTLLTLVVPKGLENFDVAKIFASNSSSMEYTLMLFLCSTLFGVTVALIFVSYMSYRSCFKNAEPIVKVEEEEDGNAALNADGAGNIQHLLDSARVLTDTELRDFLKNDDPDANNVPDNVENSDGENVPADSEPVERAPTPHPHSESENDEPEDTLSIIMEDEDEDINHGGIVNHDIPNNFVGFENPILNHVGEGLAALDDNVDVNGYYNGGYDFFFDDDFDFGFHYEDDDGLSESDLETVDDVDDGIHVGQEEQALGQDDEEAEEEEEDNEEDGIDR